jgi:hypothetical protein
MIRKVILSLLILSMVCSCSTIPVIGNKKPKRNFPSHIKNEAYGALNYAEDIIKRVGVHNIKPKDVTVQLVNGERRVGGHWAFRHVDEFYPNGIWVLGIALNWGTLIKIAVDPNNPYNIDIGTLRHEMAHHWLVANRHTDMDHYPIYDRYFDDWEYSRRVTGRNIDPSNFKIHDFSYQTSNDFIVVTSILEIDRNNID